MELAVFECYAGTGAEGLLAALVDAGADWGQLCARVVEAGLDLNALFTLSRGGQADTAHALLTPRRDTATTFGYGYDHDHDWDYPGQREATLPQAAFGLMHDHHDLEDLSSQGDTRASLGLATAQVREWVTKAPWPDGIKIRVQACLAALEAVDAMELSPWDTACILGACWALWDLSPALVACAPVCAGSTSPAGAVKLLLGQVICLAPAGGQPLTLAAAALVKGLSQLFDYLGPLRPSRVGHGPGCRVYLGKALPASQGELRVD